MAIETSYVFIFKRPKKVKIACMFITLNEHKVSMQFKFKGLKGIIKWHVQGRVLKIYVVLKVQTILKEFKSKCSYAISEELEDIYWYPNWNYLHRNGKGNKVSLFKPELDSNSRFVILFIGFKRLFWSRNGYFKLSFVSIFVISDTYELKRTNFIWPFIN